MRIGIDYTAATHQQAGIGRYTRGLVAALAQQDTDDEFVLLVTGGMSHHGGLQSQKLKAILPSNFRIRQVPLSHRIWTIIWHRLRIPLAVDAFTGPLDVFHSPDYVLPPVRQAKRVVTIHDLSYLRYPEGAEAKLRRYLNSAVPRAVRRADLVLADSRSTKNDIIELLGAPSGKVEVLYPGVDEIFRVVEDDKVLSEVSSSYGLDFPFIFTVGTVEPRKNLILLLDAYAVLREASDVPHKLVVAGGKGWLYEGVFRRVEELSLDEDVIFLGFVADENLPALYSLADVFVFPSLYEGFGLPPLEAMACGTPVITSGSSSLPEVVDEGGLMVPANDPDVLAETIRRVLNDPGLREDLAKRGVSQARKFSWQAAARRLLTLYGRLLAS
ncbi:MAG: glycosyl transferase family 1 [Chloroflexi bacterium B3_Chlor]|nr:MAG: glycosyl transferase family 1 [Chloroflexi bacterium B3_Chlor]